MNEEELRRRVSLVYWEWRSGKIGQDEAERGIRALQVLNSAIHVMYWLWSSGKVGQDTMEAARRIRAHQGNHEAEVSCGGEADLRQQFKICKKNPGHSQFIPVKHFKKEDLPSDYRDDVIVDWIKAWADLTCRLQVNHTSEHRPTYHPDCPVQFYPFSQNRGCRFTRFGTGWLHDMDKYTEEDNKNCECDECRKPSTHTPHKVWGKIDIMTAMHVVFDDDEARRTTCCFGYDTSRAILTSDCLKLTGFKYDESESNIFEDWCIITYVTHDMDIVNKLYKIFDHQMTQYSKMFLKYGPALDTKLDVSNNTSYLTDPKPCPVVIISHPHGCPKHISVGMWTHRKTWLEIEKRKTNKGTDEYWVPTSYTYNTPTCPGSSGAPLIRLLEKGKYNWFGYNAHSAGSKENNSNNISAAQSEFLRPFSLPEDVKYKLFSRLA